MLTNLHLEGGAETFRYLGHKSILKSRRDEASFNETIECLEKIGINDKDRMELLSILSGVLHLGNIDFTCAEESENDAILTPSSSLEIVSQFFGLDQESLRQAMLTKLLTVGGKTIHKPQDVGQARDKRDAFAKLAYSNLFLWLVNKINETLASEDAVARREEGFSPPPVKVKTRAVGFIGVLDIYGFENFDVNGFEQRECNRIYVLYAPPCRKADINAFYIVFV
jgi:myosin heavy subunit